MYFDKIIDSYVSNRIARVRRDLALFDIIEAEVPQGSILAPFLLLLYTSDIFIRHQVLKSNRTAILFSNLFHPLDLQQKAFAMLQIYSKKKKKLIQRNPSASSFRHLENNLNRLEMDENDKISISDEIIYLNNFLHRYLNCLQELTCLRVQVNSWSNFFVAIRGNSEIVRWKLRPLHTKFSPIPYSIARPLHLRLPSTSR